MAQLLDLNLIQQPKLPIALCDDERTAINVTFPSVDLVREFQAMEAEMISLLKSGTEKGVDAAYDLVAKIISCNEEGLTFTAADLRGRYKINLYGLIAIYKAYLAFIDETEKN